MREVVLTHSVRTAIGSIGGSLRDYDSQELSARVFRAIVERSGIEPSRVDYVIMGQTKPSTRPMNVARCGWLQAGLPDSVPASSLYRACCSGAQSIFDGVQMIQAGDAEIVIAGGVEAMSQSVYSLRFARNGVGNTNAVFYDALTENGPGHAPASIYGNITQGMTAEIVAEHYNVTREEMDRLSVRSHTLARQAIAGGVFRDEIVAVDGFDTDEHPRDTSIEQLSKLKPSFKSDGTVTAGNSSGRNDAASCVLIMSLEKAQELGIKPVLRFVSAATTAIDPTYLLMGPVDAVPKALKKAGISLRDIDLIELNEAFASSTVATLRELARLTGEGYEDLLERTNIYGSGISLGHPPGATGAIMTTKLMHEMKRRPELRYGMVTMCVGGGHGFATIWKQAAVASC